MTINSPSKSGETNIFQTAKSLFRRNAMPTRLVGRAQEREKLDRFWDGQVTARKAGCLYISGSPGTGKTAMLNQLVTKATQTAEITNTKILLINCMSIKEPKGVYTKLLQGLLGEDAELERDTIKQAKAMFIGNGARTSETFYVVVLDEIDHLLSKDQDVLYKIFEWPTLPNARLTLIGISNALDLTERFLPRLRAKNLDPMLLNFNPYGVDDIKNIIQDRLLSLKTKVPLFPAEECKIPFEVPLIAPQAIELCARKVAASTGDLRKALDVCRQAIEIVEMDYKAKASSPKRVLGEHDDNKNATVIPVSSLTAETAPKVTVSIVLKVLQNMLGSPVQQKLRALNFQQRIVIAALYIVQHSIGVAKPIGGLAFSATHRKDTTLGSFIVQYSALCKDNELITPLSRSELIDIIRLLESSGVVRINGHKDEKLRKVELSVGFEDIKKVILDDKVLASSPRPGAMRRRKEVGDYWLGKTLGKGSSGRVKLGTHKVTGEQVAIKIISKTHLASNAAVEKAVKREIAIMKLIDHPNIMSLYDVIDVAESSDLYLILEYVRGGELFEYLVQKGRLAEAEARHYFQQIIFGLDYCHQHLICHRDLKPENLLLDDKNIKIADFGMASLQPQGSMLETSCGSPHYASPEIVTGLPYNGAASDIWSCGIILYALLTGHLPFDDENIRQLLNKVKTGKYQMPMDISERAQDLIRRTLTLNPANRITMKAIQAHPWFILSPPRNPAPISNPPSALELDGILANGPGDLDDRILKSLRILWGDDKDEEIVQKLLSKEHNMQKVTYVLLERHARSYWEDDHGGWDAGGFYSPQLRGKTPLTVRRRSWTPTTPAKTPFRVAANALNIRTAKAPQITPFMSIPEETRKSNDYTVIDIPTPNEDGVSENKQLVEVEEAPGEAAKTGKFRGDEVDLELGIPRGDAMVNLHESTPARSLISTSPPIQQSAPIQVPAVNKDLPIPQYQFVGLPTPNPTPTSLELSNHAAQNAVVEHGQHNVTIRKYEEFHADHNIASPPTPGSTLTRIHAQSSTMNDLINVDNVVESKDPANVSMPAQEKAEAKEVSNPVDQQEISNEMESNTRERQRSRIETVSLHIKIVVDTSTQTTPPTLISQFHHLTRAASPAMAKQMDEEADINPAVDDPSFAMIPQQPSSPRRVRPQALSPTRDRQSPLTKRLQLPKRASSKPIPIIDASAKPDPEVKKQVRHPHAPTPAAGPAPAATAPMPRQERFSQVRGWMPKVWAMAAAGPDRPFSPPAQRLISPARGPQLPAIPSNTPLTGKQLVPRKTPGPHQLYTPQIERREAMNTQPIPSNSTESKSLTRRNTSASTRSHNANASLASVNTQATSKTDPASNVQDEQPRPRLAPSRESLRIASKSHTIVGPQRFDVGGWRPRVEMERRSIDAALYDMANRDGGLGIFAAANGISPAKEKLKIPMTVQDELPTLEPLPRESSPKTPSPSRSPEITRRASASAISLKSTLSQRRSSTVTETPKSSWLSSLFLLKNPKVVTITVSAHDEWDAMITVRRAMIDIYEGRIQVRKERDGSMKWKGEMKVLHQGKSHVCKFRLEANQLRTQQPMVSVTFIQQQGDARLLVGVQFTWSVELSYGTPYLLSLDLSEELTALVWLAGPLSGRRRPFIIAGGAIVCVTILSLAFARELGHMLAVALHPELSMVGNPEVTDWAKFLTIAVCITSFYLLDFSLNAVQASCRALVLDVAPAAQQGLANAWASRMSNVAACVGYTVGMVDLVGVGSGSRSDKWRWIDLVMDSQMKIFCEIAVLVFILFVGITCVGTKEVPLGREEATEDEETGSTSSKKSTLGNIIDTIQTMPAPIKRLCHVQFFAWMGWFPFLFYSSTWISHLYMSTHPMDSPDAWTQGTRQGSLALLYFAIISLVSGLLLPLMTPRLISLKSIFSCSLMFFAVTLTLGAILTSTVAGGKLVIASLGIPWSVALWVPFGLIGAYLQQPTQPHLSPNNGGGIVIVPERDHVDDEDNEPSYIRIHCSEDKRKRSFEEEDILLGLSTSPSSSFRSVDTDSIAKRPPPPSYSTFPRATRMYRSLSGTSATSYASTAAPPSFTTATKPEPPQHTAGMILGVHNMYIVLPQFIVAIIAAAMFRFVGTPDPADKPTANGVDQGIVYVLMFGGFMAFVAFGLSRRL
ncbi:hypothetical protein BZG36_04713 [Bifiguratus adelaidae]|uniref:non-specific serine/threonine protein kinase n=1 Tax=Bifiguratus adelaidae TaxID=1938954 RepID=A0A261XV42_9FUNG|nr:hypothetical protein BZG36_04713 [Bifiguratus adelaidae]